ncbi:MAG: 50S ribosomal protein L4 [Actinobacteria bacterium]|nr:50S ribosomal protein L4 [Actinomycetota bacterium]
MAVTVRSQSGSSSGTLELDPAYFAVQPNIPVMHQVVTAQLAAARAGTHSTLTRAEVRGGGKKPWRQKGTGRARQGSTRAPHWSGGGVAFGPKPRSYRQKTPKKMIQLALRGALSDRAADNKIVVVDAWEFPAPKTKDATAALDALNLSGRVLVVLSRDDEVAFKSFRNLGDVQIILADELNPYDILTNDWIVFTRATLPGATDAPSAPAVEPAIAVAAEALAQSEDAP